MSSDNLPALPDLKQPRMGKHASKPGAYTIIIESDRSTVYYGEKITLKLFISGYGVISNPKLFVSMPPGLHDESKSSIYHSFGPKQDRLQFGVQKMQLPQRLSFKVNGVQKNGWEENSLLFDIDSDSDGTPRVLTETASVKAPFEFEIAIFPLWHFWSSYKTRPRAGSHAVQFVLTFFDGEAWRVDKASYNIVLESWYQRHVLLTWAFGTLLAIIALIWRVT